MRIGVDLGGSKTEALALGSDGLERARRRVATPRGDYDSTLRTVVDLVAGLETEMDGRSTVGIGIPGAISPATGMVKNANSTWLNGRPLDRDLEMALTPRPVRIANDADCFALSEASDGAGAGADPVFGVILGTGVGGGIVVNGRLLGGPNAIAGEWGHNPLPAPKDDERPGPACFCGRRGCIETFLSGPGLAADYVAHGGRPNCDARTIAELAAGANPTARAALDRYLDRLARSLAHVINLIDPEVIVLGGGLSNVATFYEELPARLPPYVFSDRMDTRIVPPRHGDSSGVRGAARLWAAEERP